MEKMDIIIFFLEELVVYMVELIISVISIYEYFLVVLMVDDIVIGILGNFSVFIGKVKSKKIFNVLVIVVLVLSGSIVFYYWFMFFENKWKILYIDIE